MDYTSTLNKLIQHSYGELSENESILFQNEISQSVEMQSIQSLLDEIKSCLDSEMFEPNPTSVQIILEESLGTEAPAC
ncbi:MAG: hypothetical protein H6607_05040 [Flavobacteriales bacterium]|nr:hypothetical protein [Flavobacteriales bacterium]